MAERGLDERKVAQYFALVKDLNTQKTNWDVLEKGEVIRLPVPAGSDASTVVASAPASASPVTSAVGSASSRVRLPALARTSSPATITAPTGTSPRSPAASASASATSMGLLPAPAVVMSASSRSNRGEALAAASPPPLRRRDRVGGMAEH